MLEVKFCNENSRVSLIKDEEGLLNNMKEQDIKLISQIISYEYYTFCFQKLTIDGIYVLLLSEKFTINYI